MFTSKIRCDLYKINKLIVNTVFRIINNKIKQWKQTKTRIFKTQHDKQRNREFFKQKQNINKQN